MGRTPWITGAALAAAAWLAGCGANDTAPGAVTVAAHVEPAAAHVAAATAGRLGPATSASGDGPLVVLSPGGRPDLRPRDAVAPRDGVGAAAACPGPEVAPAAESMAAVLRATLCLVNAERVDRGLARLAGNARLDSAARRYAADLVAGRYFSHTGRDGSDVSVRLRRAGYLPASGAWFVGENLAWGTGPLATPAAVVRAWMNSPGHRENMLNRRFREIGLGVALGNPAGAEGPGATYATTFGVVTAAPGRRALRSRTARAAKRRVASRRAPRR